jgi:phthalate 4,5-dioxygenase oxygenase subunit
MRAAVAAVAAGEPAIGTAEPRIRHALLASFEGLVPKSRDWRTLNLSEEERSIGGSASAEPADQLRGKSS